MKKEFNLSEKICVICEKKFNYNSTLKKYKTNKFIFTCSLKCFKERQKEEKKLERQIKINEKNRLESEYRKFEEWEKSGSRTY